MKRELIFTWDSEIKTKEHLHLDFDANVSYLNFIEWCKDEKEILDFPLRYSTKNNDDIEFLHTIFSLYPANFWLEDNMEVFEAIDIVRVAILSWLSSFFTDKRILKGILYLLRWDYIKTYKDIGINVDDIKELRSNEEYFNTIDKYNNSDEWDWWRYKNKDILNNEEYDEDINIFYTILDNFWYEEDVEENDSLLYVIYCILFLKLDLYLTYIPSKSWFMLSVVDEKQLHLHMINWSYVLNLSTIILNIYKWINIEGLENYSSLSKIIEDQSWKKLFQDLKNDSQYKNKVTFTIDTRDNKPLFMSSKWKEEDMNRYKEIEEMIWENWSIEKKMNHWKWSSIAIKKQYLYWNKAR